MKHRTLRHNLAVAAVIVATGTFYDKNWTVCDNHPAGPFYGHCYTEFDTAASGDREDMSTSTNGGSSWTSSVLIARTSHHTVAGLEAEDMSRAAAIQQGLRESVLPSAEIDASGKVYVSWADWRFRSGCTSNDIILSTSTTGKTWTSPVRVPIDAITSGADHFTPGLGVDTSTSGATTRIGLTYYYYPVANCTTATCQLDVGYISSTNGGTTWSAPTQLAGPMQTTWLPNTTQGRMFGDYIATTTLSGGNAITVVPVASAPSRPTFNMAVFAPTGGLPITGRCFVS